MSLTFGELKQDVQDLCQNFNVTTIDKGNIDRQTNRSIEYVQRKLGLPSDIKTHSFYYYDDTKFYDCPAGFNELLQVYYNTDSIVDADHNYPINRWFPFKDSDILRDTAGKKYKNRVSFTTINGKNQLLLSGSNLRGNSTINSFDSLSGLTFSADVASQEIDSYVYKQGSGSLKFNIASGLSATTISFTGVYDIRELLNINSAYRIYIDFPTGTTGYFTNVELRLQSSVGNYYSITATTQDDLSAWASNAWSRLGFSLSSKTIVGTPDPSAITSFIVVFNHSGTFAPVTGIRVDYLYQVNPDYMNATYYSAYKGTDSTGATPKIILTEDTDLLSFGTYAQDLRLPISLRATLSLFPQLRGDINFWQIYKQDHDEVLKLYSRTYPRKRSSQSGSTEILR